MFLRILIFVSILNLVGCATVTPPQTTSPQNLSQSTIAHTVLKGQTLWRISKIYDVDPEDIVKINKITDSALLTTGDVLRIPTSTTQTTTGSRNFASSEDFSGNSDFIWPVKGKLLSHFRQKINGTSNKGIDIEAGLSQDILSCADGKVIFIGQLAGYGETIIIDHADDISSVYCGTGKIAVHVGDDTKQGTLLGRPGKSPRHGDGTLHFEIRKKNKPLNPLYFLS